jgi:hypothetical protein
VITAAELLSVYSTPILPCSPGLVKRFLWDPLVRALRVSVWLPRIVWISFGHSEIESKSTWFRCLSPRRLVTSDLDQVLSQLPAVLQQIYLIIPLSLYPIILFINLLS